MKALIFLLLLPFAVFAQTTTKGYDSDGTLSADVFEDSLMYKVGTVVKCPRYVGGEEAMVKYLQANLHHQAQSDKLTAMFTDSPVEAVEVYLVVLNTGKVGHVSAYSMHPGLAAETERVVSNMPAWIPGHYKTKDLNTIFSFTIVVSKKDGISIKQSLEYQMEDISETIDQENAPGEIRTANAETKKTEEPAVADNPQKTTSDQVYTIVEQMPEFEGGRSALKKYLADNTVYPSIAAENGIEGTCYVQFVVTSTGSVDQVKAVRSVDKYLDKEAIRVESSMPNWKPGMQNGKAVSVYYTVPVRFNLDNYNKADKK